MSADLRPDEDCPLRRRRALARVAWRVAWLLLVTLPLARYAGQLAELVAADVRAIVRGDGTRPVTGAAPVVPGATTPAARPRRGKK